ncbi:MAG: family 16 glycoside hydrolase [Chloroflexota bacterium]
MNAKNCFRTIAMLLLVGIVLLLISPSIAQEGGFRSSFDNPELPDWEQTDNVMVIDGALFIEGNGFALHGGMWSDILAELRFKWVGNGAVAFHYQAGDGGSFMVHLGNEGIRLLVDQPGELIELGFAPIDVPQEVWQELKIENTGDTHIVYLNGEQILDGISPEVLPPGGVVLRAEGDVAVSFDELIIEVGTSQEPVDEPSQPQEPGGDSSEPLPVSELSWVRTGGPPGGMGYDIRYNFDNPDIWYVTDAFAGIHTSTDNGKTWKPSNQGIPKQAGKTGDGLPIFCLTVDPHNSQIIWSGTNDTGHIYRSVDGGKTWEQRDNGVTIEYDFLTFRGFTVDPRSSDIVYAMGETTSMAGGGPAVWGLGTGGVVYKTTNAGEQWHVIWDGGMPSSLTRYMWINPRDPEVLYVSTGLFDRGAVGEGDPETEPIGGIGILKSMDGGETWQIQNEANGLEMLYLGSLYMHPEDPEILLAAAGHTTEGRIDFFEQYGIAHGHSIGGIFRTENGGEQWKRVLSSARHGEAFAAVEICSSDPNIAYAASDLAVYRSQDAGKNWNQMTAEDGYWGLSGIIPGFPIDIQCDPRDPGRLFINNYSGGNFLSENGGQTWEQASQGYTGATLRSVAVDPRNPARIYAAGKSGAWLSEDGGLSWNGLSYSPSDFGMSFEQGTIRMDPQQSGHLLLSDIAGTAILESYDGGHSWHLRLTNLSFEMIGLKSGGKLLGLFASNFIFTPSKPAIVYASLTHDLCYRLHESCAEMTGDGYALIVSQDGGTSWESVNGEIPGRPEIIDITVAPDDEKVIYAATGTGLFRSEDAGAIWTMLPGLPGGMPVRAVAVNPIDSTCLLAGLDQLGIYISRDGGQTWQPGISGLEANGSLHDIIFDPTDSRIAYTSDLLSGVYQSIDGGVSWMKINHGLLNRAALDLDISSDGKHLYVGIDGGGVFRLDLNGQAPVPKSSSEPESELVQPLPVTEPPADSQPPPEPGEPPETTSPDGSLCSGAMVLPLAIMGFWVIQRRKTSD